jgi:hypothetical protein
MRKGQKFTGAQRETLKRSHLGQRAWNKGNGGCKKGHDPSLYKPLPSGVYYCFGCKRENGLKYRQRNREQIRKNGRLRRYGLSIARFEELWAEQDGKCAICKDHLRTSRGNKNRDGYRIDHSHSNGKVRGILCHSCNTALGLFKDSRESLMKAIRYLEGVE